MLLSSQTQLSMSPEHLQIQETKEEAPLAKVYDRTRWTAWIVRRSPQKNMPKAYEERFSQRWKLFKSISIVLTLALASQTCTSITALSSCHFHSHLGCYINLVSHYLSLFSLVLALSSSLIKSLRGSAFLTCMLSQGVSKSQIAFSQDEALMDIFQLLAPGKALDVWKKA